MASRLGHSSKFLASGIEPSAKISAALDTRGSMNSIETNGQKYTLECLNTPEQMLSIQQDWEMLHQQSTEPFTYFQSFDWCYKWAQSFAAGSESELKIYVLRCGTDAVLIWPMTAVWSRARVKVLVGLSDPLGQYSGLLIDANKVSEELGFKVLSLMKADCGCDAISILNCPQGSFLERVTRPVGFAEDIQPVSSIFDLDEIPVWDEYHASLPRNKRKERNKRRNKLEAQGKLEYNVYPAGTKEYAELIEVCLDYKQVWLSETGRRGGILAAKETQDFFLNLECIVENGKPVFGAVVHCLSLKGHPIGLELGMIQSRDYYSYLGAIDWDMRSYSPGKVQMEFAQRWAKETGIRWFDFLSDPSDYKAYWTNRSQALISLNVPITFKGQLYCRLWKANLKPRLKAFYHKTGAANRVVFNRLFELLGRSKQQ